MEEKDLDEFENDNMINENNEELLSNDYLDNNSSTSINKNNGIKIKIINRYSMISLFIVMCSILAIVYKDLKIPILSNIFNKEEEIIEPKIIETTESKIDKEEPVIIAPSYTFSKLDVTYKSINYKICIDNVSDFENNLYSLMVVKKDFDNEIYISTIPFNYKNIHKVYINSNSIEGSFDTYITKDGVRKISKNTEYSLLILCDDKIVFKKDVKTSDFNYINKLEIKYDSDLMYKYLKIKVIVNEEFKNFNYIYIEIYNLDKKCVYDQYSILYKDYLSESYASIPFNIKEPTSKYEIRIYCHTDNKDEFDYPSSFVKDELPYYLIYTYDNIIEY